MSEFRNCPRCGRVFNYVSSPICGKCLQEEEDDFKKVREYIYDNPGSNMVDVSDATEVPVERIMRFLKEERLEIQNETSSMVLECERCGKSIKTGRFCEACKEDLKSAFKKEAEKSKASEAAFTPQKSGKDEMFTARRRGN